MKDPPLPVAGERGSGAGYSSTNISRESPIFNSACMILAVPDSSMRKSSVASSAWVQNSSAAGPSVTVSEGVAAFGIHEGGNKLKADKMRGDFLRRFTRFQLQATETRSPS